MLLISFLQNLLNKKREIFFLLFVLSVFFIFIPLNIQADNCYDECSYCTRPSSPTVSPSATNETTINITESVSGADYYTLKRGETSLGTNAGSYNDTGRNPGTEYSYSANACDGNCENCSSYICGELTCWHCVVAPDLCSSYSSGASEITPFYSPSSLNAICSLVGNDAKVALSWSDNSSVETGYKVEENYGSGYSVVSTEGANSTSYETTSVYDGVWYYYRVRAYHSSGSYSSYSSASSCLTPISVPTGFSATAASASQINLSWTDNSSGESGFKIERATGACSGFSQIATASANATSYSDTSVSDGRLYCYRIRAYTTATNSSYSSSASDTTPLAAPTNLSASASGSTINVSWTDNSVSESYFKIERASGACSSYAQVTTTSSTSYADSNTIEGTTYCYRARAYNVAAGNSDYSNTDDATTALTAPSNLSATAASDSQINLSWSDNSNGEEGYKIERAAGGCSGFSQIDTVLANVNTYQNTGLTSGTLYCYRVRAYSGSTNSSYSNNASATATIAAPTSLSATTASISRINLSWTDNSSGESGFKIERATGACSGFSQITTVGANTTSYANTGLSEGTTYCYRIRAYTAAGNSDYSNTDSATTNLSAPSSLTATTVSGTQINLSWTDNSTGETGFKVERAINSCSGFSQIGTTSASSYSSTGLENSATYCYRVRAYTSATNSSYSNTASDTTKTPPAAPSGLTVAAVSATQINLSWTDNSDNETGFRIRRAVGAVCNSSSGELTTVAENSASYNNTSLCDGTTYCYVVCAYNNDGENCSSSDSDTTSLSAPTSFAYGTIGQTSIAMSWSDNSTCETGFKVEKSTADCSSGFSQIDTTTSGAYTNTNLTCSGSANYCYRVRAYTDYTNSSYLTAGSVKQTLPCSPSSLSASSISESQINLSWSDNSANETGFQVERKTGAGGSWGLATTTAAGITSYSDIGLSDGKVYYYRNKACNNDGCSTYATESFATTTLAAPDGLVCAPFSSSRIDLSWNDNSLSETAFNIERATSSPPTTQVAAVGQNTTSYSNINLSEETLYYYRVRAHNSASGVYSSYSDICSTTTLVYIPTGSLTSSIFDTGLTDGAAFNFIKWRGTQPSGSRVLFQFASSNSTTSWQYFGPDGTEAGYYESAADATGVSPAVLATRFHNNHRYFRYKIFLYPNESAQSPVVNEVVVGYSP